MVQLTQMFLPRKSIIGFPTYHFDNSMTAGATTLKLEVLLLQFLKDRLLKQAIFMVKWTLTFVPSKSIISVLAIPFLLFNDSWNPLIWIPLQITLMQEESIRPIKSCTIITKFWLFVHTLFFINAEFQAKKQQEPFFKSLVWLCWGSNHWSQTQSGCSNHYATEVGQVLVNFHKGCSSSRLYNSISTNKR